MGIEKFLKKGAREDRVDKFERLSKDKPKEEVREMEAALLKPDVIPDYVGELSKFVRNADTTVKLVFKSKEDMELVGRHLVITAYIEPSISNINIVLDLFKAIEAGKISYDKKTRAFTFNETTKNNVINIDEIPNNAEEPKRKLLRRKCN